MSDVHPLDHAVWSALSGRQSDIAIVDGGARRYQPAYGIFAGVKDGSAASMHGLGRLVLAHGDVALLQPEAPSGAPGVVVHSQDLGVQMRARHVTPGPAPAFEMVPLTDADGPEMLVLATLTQPGPFFEKTHLLGDFYGVREEGRLVAMAGERMKPEGHTEVSGVCTHPDHRGRGYAAALMRLVATRILDRGEIPFLHAYASNKGAIALYETLGFELRREVVMTRLTRR